MTKEIINIAKGKKARNVLIALFCAGVVFGMFAFFLTHADAAHGEIWNTFSSIV